MNSQFCNLIQHSTLLFQSNFRKVAHNGQCFLLNFEASITVFKYIYIYIYIYVCVCVCVCEYECLSGTVARAYKEFVSLE
jgi:hypothetical protein